MASSEWGWSSQTLDTAPPPLQICDYTAYTKRVLLIYFQVLESYNEKLLSLPNNNVYLLQSSSTAIFEI